MAEGLYRTFVRLDPYERWILRVLQAGMHQAGKKKPAVSRIIGTVLRDYWEQFEQEADPEMLEKLKTRVPPPV